MTEQETPRVVIPGTFALLGKTFSIYRKHFGLLFGYSAWLLVPLVVSLLAFISFEKEVADLVDFTFNILLYALLTAWLGVVFISLTPHLRKDRKINSSSIGMDAWYLLIPYLIVGLVVGLINLIGFFALVIPGLIVSTLLAFSGIIVVLEKAQLSQAMQKSWRLTKPVFFRVFVRLYGGMILFFLLYVLLITGVEAIDILLNGSTLEAAIMAEPSILDETLYRFIEILLLPAIVIYQTLLYIWVRKAGPPKELEQNKKA